MNELSSSNSPVTFDPIWQRDDFFHRSAQIALQLQQDNIRSVALCCEDAAYFACALLGCFTAKVRVLLPPNLLAENRLWIERNADLFIDDRLFEQLGLTQKQVKNRPHFDVYSEMHNQTEIWLKTSGSSGEAKIIVKTAEQMWLEAQQLATVLPFKAEQRIHIVGSVSVQHLYGLTFRIMLPLFNGWTIGRKQQLYPEYLIAESRRHSQSLWISSPALLTRLNLANPDLLSCPIVGMISSGGALAEKVAENISNGLKCPLVEIYGSSETGAIAFRQNTKLWQTLPDMRIGSDERGALWVESKRITGREQTADAVEIHQQGFVLLGRIDRIVKLGDKRVSLVKIEQDLQQHQWIKDCYVAQHPDLQRVVAWLALSEEGIEMLREKGRKTLIEQLRQSLQQTQEKFALPRFWRFTDELPRNSQSKISRSDFEQICRQQLTDPLWFEQHKEENSLRLSGKIPLDLIYFKGHFADFPLVPGVVELQWVMDQIPHLLGRDIVVERIDNLKFQQFLRPNDRLDLSLQWDAMKNRVAFQLKSNDKMCGSGLIISKIEHNEST